MTVAELKPHSATLEVDLSDFPSPAELAEREGDFVPAAGYRTVVVERKAFPGWLTLAGVVMAATLGAHRLLVREKAH